MKIEKIYVVAVMAVCIMFIQNAAAFNQPPNAPAFNQPPVAYIDVKPASIYACGIIEIDGSASVDPDGQVVFWKWSRVNEGEAEEYLGSGKKLVLEWPYTKESGPYEIKLTVTDNKRGLDSTTIVVWVKYNRPPQIERIEIVGLDNGIVLEGEKFTLKAVIEPNTDDDLLVWRWSYDGKIFNFSNASVVEPEVQAIVSPEIYETYHNIRAEVSDTCGRKDEKAISVGVKKRPYNSPPLAIITLPDVIEEGRRFIADGSGSKTGNGFNEPDDSLDYQWSWRKYGDNKTLGSVGGKKAALVFSDGGIAYEIFLNVTDKYGLSAVTSTVIFIQETEDDMPIANAGATMRNVIVGQNFTLNGSLSYDDRDFMDRGIQTYVWQISAVFNKTPWSSEEIRTNKPVISYRLNRVGEYTVKLTVIAAGFQENSDTIKIIVSEPEKPAEAQQATSVVAPRVSSVPAPAVIPKNTAAELKKARVTFQIFVGLIVGLSLIAAVLLCRNYHNINRK